MAVATTGATRKIKAKIQPPIQGLKVSLLAGFTGSESVLLAFPKSRRRRRRATAGSRQLVIDDNEPEEVKRGMLLGPKGR